jgi:hypothetical protein
MEAEVKKKRMIRILRMLRKIRKIRKIQRKIKMITTQKIQIPSSTPFINLAGILGLGFCIPPTPSHNCGSLFSHNLFEQAQDCHGSGFDSYNSPRRLRDQAVARPDSV